jgi:hypothetical protein
MQGTLTTAALLVEQSVLMESMMDEPALVHSLLSTICDHLLAYQRHLRGGSAGRLLGNIWPRANLPEDLGVSLTEDYMPLLSPRLYQEFGIPYLRRIADSFGGALIHCCGRWGRHAGTLAASGIAIRAVEFHHAYTTVDELKPLAERGVVLVPYMSSSQPGFPDAITYYRHLIASTPWRYLFALDDSPAEQAFARELADRDLTPA